MKYSENSNYQQFMSRRASGDLEGAKQALVKCLSELGKNDHVQRSDLLQRLGSLVFEQGDAAKALEYYEKSEASDPTSLLAPYYYAKFLAEKLKQHERAIAKCDAIISKATALPFKGTDEDFGSDDYVRMAKELKQTCVAAKGGTKR